MTFSEKCLQAIEDGNMEEAQKEFAWALRKDDDEILFNLAEQLYALGLMPQARRAYLKLLERYPDEDASLCPGTAGGGRPLPNRGAV